MAKHQRDDKKLLIEQLEHMAEKLKAEGPQVESESMTVSTENGEKENPFFPAYERLLKSYTQTLKALKELSGDEVAEVSSIDDIRQRFKVAK